MAPENGAIHGAPTGFGVTWHCVDILRQGLARTSLRPFCIRKDDFPTQLDYSLVMIRIKCGRKTRQ